MEDRDGIEYLLSFLAILVHRAGGTLTVENLSEYSGADLKLGMKLEPSKDRVILHAIGEKP